MTEFEKYRRIVVCAQQAGGGAVIAGLLRKMGAPLAGKIYAYRPAAGFFNESPLPCIVVDKRDEIRAKEILASERPEAVWLGSSVGYSLEKALMVEAGDLGIPVFCFVDHYWNLWQRFAHEKTAARWSYLPTRIYVIDRQSRERILSLGCPPRLVRVCGHPVLKSIPNEQARFSRDVARRRLGIAEDAAIALFVAEWEYRSSAKWRFDQPRREDVAYLLASLLRAAATLQKKRTTVIVIKTHPEDPDACARQLRSFDRSLYREIGAFDKPSLLDMSDAVFGLNSMMLLEALARRRPVYSLHRSKSGRDMWLSTWNRGIRELHSAQDCESVLRRLRLKGN